MSSSYSLETPYRDSTFSPTEPKAVQDRGWQDTAPTHGAGTSPGRWTFSSWDWERSFLLPST